MKLEDQLAELASLGLVLGPDVTIEDLLHSFDREDYEEKPFDLVLFTLGVEVEREPWGRHFCPKAWNFDTECIEGPGSYVAIVENLARIADATGRITEVSDGVDFDEGEGWLEYVLDGKRRRFAVEVEADWADTEVVSNVMADLEVNGRRFYAKDNGQAAVLFYLDEAAAARLNRLSNDSLTPAVSQEPPNP
jgi:hypothetical protein